MDRIESSRFPRSIYSRATSVSAAYVHDDSDVTCHVCQTPAIKMPDENRSNRNDRVLFLDISETALEKKAVSYKRPGGIILLFF